jgi:hypothetical protein
MTRLIAQAGVLIFPILLLLLTIVVLAVRNGLALWAGHRTPAAGWRLSIDSVLFWGGLAAVLGFLGQWMGVNKMSRAVAEQGIVSPRAVTIGLAESLVTPVAGMTVLVVAAFLWFLLRIGLWSIGRREES